MSTPAEKANAQKQAEQGQEAKNLQHIQCQFCHLNIHASTGAAAGFIQTILEH